MTQRTKDKAWNVVEYWKNLYSLCRVGDIVDNRDEGGRDIVYDQVRREELDGLVQGLLCCVLVEMRVLSLLDRLRQSTP